MNSYVLSRDAAQDIEAIWEYIAQDNLEAADGVIESFLEACRLLAENPYAGHVRPDLAEARPIRFWPVGNY